MDILGKTMSKNQGGRYKDPIWSEFVEVKDAGGKVSYECKNCKKKVSGKVLRLRNHKHKCKNLSSANTDSDSSNGSPPMKRSSAAENSRMSVSPLPSSSSSDASQLSRGRKESIEYIHCHSNQSVTSIDSVPVAAFVPQSVGTTKATKQLSIGQYTIKTSAAKKEELDLQVARFFYSCNIPFLAAERQAFLNLIKILRPGYIPPTRKQLSGALLDQIYEEVTDKAKADLHGKNVTLVQDGWSSIHNDPIIVNCVSSGQDTYFVTAVDTETNKKTAEYCLKLAKEAKKEAYLKFGCEVKSFVSDNEKKMQVMRKKLQEDLEDKEFISYGCASHYLNLTGQDITEKVSALTKHIVEVQKYFRNHHQPGAYLKEYPDSVKPQIPGETRWNSQIICLETFLRNREFYLKIVDDHESDIDKNITKKINDVSIYKEAKSLYKQLKPIAAALDNLQSEEASISTACCEWLKLVNNNELQPYADILKFRFEQAITPAHILAYLLDPKYMGEGLTAPQQESTRIWLLELNPAYLPLVISFQAEEDPFPKSYFTSEVRNNVKASIWWKSMKNSMINQEFLNFIIHLHNCPSSSAGIERLFSNYSFVQNKLRNRLGLEKASKLVVCYKMLNKKGAAELDW